MATTAVIALKQQFTSLDEPTIQKVLQECNGDTNQAIIILMKVEQFNRSMNQANVNPQNGEGQAISTQNANQVAISPVQIQAPIPLQVVQVNTNNLFANIRTQHPTWALYLDKSPNHCMQCCDPINCQCCAQSCASCYMIPDQYKLGLYKIDLTVKNISFLLFILMTFVGEVTVIVLREANRAFYIPIIGLTILLFASILFFFSKTRTETTLNRVIGWLYISGGFLYFVGYIYYTAVVETYSTCDHGTVCDCSYTTTYQYEERCFCTDQYGETEYGTDRCYYNYHWGDEYRYSFTAFAPYFLMRGGFIFYSAVLMGLHYIQPMREYDRLTLIRIDSILFGLFIICVFGWVIPDIQWHFAFSAMMHDWMGVLLFVNAAIACQNVSQGGCTGYSITGTMLMVFYSIEMILIITFLLIQVLEEDFIVKPNIFNYSYLFWSFGVVVFGSMHLWIYLRMIHPAFVHCTSKKIQKDVVSI
eukprot:14816_1